MAKKPVKKEVKKEVKEIIPPDILLTLKRIKTKFFKDKDDTLEMVKQEYLKIYNKDKKKYGDKKWSDVIFHRRALSKLKNKKKSEKLGGAIDKYYGVIMGVSAIRDLTANRRAEILEMWKDDPNKAMNEGYIMKIEVENPETGEVEKVPVTNSDGNIVPRDNIEFRKRKDGTKFKNPTFNHAIGHSYRRYVIGVCINTQGVKGVFMQELRDKSATDLDVTVNCLVKFSGKTIGTEIISLKENKYIDRDLLKEMITNLEFDIEEGKITEDFAEEMKKYYNNLLVITRPEKKKKKPPEQLKKEKKLREKVRKEFEITFFSLRSTKGTTFTIIENEEEFENIDFPKRDHMEIDINLLYKQYFYPFTSDCSNLLKYHEDHHYIDNDPDKINYRELVCLQDVNLIQMNMEASMSGNYTFQIEDDSLFNKDVMHLDEEIDAIRLLIPSNLNPTYFGQDSKLIIIGAPVQFQVQDSDNKDLFETVTKKFEDEEGNTITEEVEVPVLGFPTIMVYGIFPIPEYMVKVKTFDLTLEDETEEKEKSKKSSPKKKPKSKKREGKEEIKGAIEDVEKIEEEIEEEVGKTDDEDVEEEEEEETDEGEEDEEEDEDLW